MPRTKGFRCNRYRRNNPLDQVFGRWPACWSAKKCPIAKVLPPLLAPGRGAAGTIDRLQGPRVPEVTPGREPMEARQNKQHPAVHETRPMRDQRLAFGTCGKLADGLWRPGCQGRCPTTQEAVPARPHDRVPWRAFNIGGNGPHTQRKCWHAHGEVASASTDAIPCCTAGLPCQLAASVLPAAPSTLIIVVPQWGTGRQQIQFPTGRPLTRKFTSADAFNARPVCQRCTARRGGLRRASPIVSRGARCGRARGAGNRSRSGRAPSRRISTRRVICSDNDPQAEIPFDAPRFSATAGGGRRLCRIEGSRINHPAPGVAPCTRHRDR